MSENGIMRYSEGVRDKACFGDTHTEAHRNDRMRDDSAYE